MTNRPGCDALHCWLGRTGVEMERSEISKEEYALKAGCYGTTIILKKFDVWICSLSHWALRTILIAIFRSSENVLNDNHVNLMFSKSNFDSDHQFVCTIISPGDMISATRTALQHRLNQHFLMELSVNYSWSYSVMKPSAYVSIQAIYIGYIHTYPLSPACVTHQQVLIEQHGTAFVLVDSRSEAGPRGVTRAWKWERG